MFTALGRWAARRRRFVVVGTVLFVALAGWWGSGAFGAFAGGAGFDNPNGESARANEILSGALGRHATDVVVLFTGPDRTVDDPAYEAAVAEAVSRIPASAVSRVDTYWSTGSSDLVSADRTATYIGLQLAGSTEEENVVVYQDLIADRLDVPGYEVRYGGLVPVNDQVNALTSSDLLRAELVSIPILLLVLVLVFRGLIAAALPLVVGVVVAVGSLAVLRVVGAFYDVSSFSINVVTLLGLGLAIDYGLLVVTRFREELAVGATVDDAVARTMAAAGRTVAFSGAAIALTLVGLLVFPSRFLVSMAFAIVSVVLFAVLAVLVLLPALLRIVGTRIDALPLWRRRPPVAVRQGRWYRTAKAVMRRPVAVTVGLSIALLAVGAPLLGVQWGRPSDWVLPAGADARVVDDVLDAQFPRDPVEIVTVVLERPGSAAAAAEFAVRLDQVPGVDGATVTGFAGDTARITLGYAMDPQSAEAAAMVEALRATPPPPGAAALFANFPASLADMLTMLADGLPWLALYIAVVSFVVLFLAFGSVLIPLQSLLLNVLSLAAAFGVIALVFQYGVGSGLLGFVPEGVVDANMPMLILVIAFGLAMDYQVFTISRIRELWASGVDLEEAVAVGVQRSGRVISAAAVLFVVVVGGFVLSDITFMMMMGVGLIVAVVVDATVVRGLLVPATLRLLGERAWWAPAPLARWWQRRGVPETAVEPELSSIGSR